MIIYGINPVTEALRSGSQPLERIWISRRKANPRVQRIIELARTQGVPVRFESTEVLNKKASTAHHQQVIAQLAPISYTDVDSLLETQPALLLLVDGVQDPHNLGALLRTAEAAGVGGVLVAERHSCGVTPAVVKSSAGAATHLKISRIGNVVRALKRLKEEGFWIVGLDIQGQDLIDQVDVTLPLMVLVGGEHRGVRRLVRKHCDFLVSLPMKGRVSSLNLSVAAGVLLYEIVLRREQQSTNSTVS